jgi:hypothetical protein
VFSITTIQTWLNCGTPLGSLQSSEAPSQVKPARQAPHPLVAPLELLEVLVVAAAAPLEEVLEVLVVAVAAPLDEVVVAAAVELETETPAPLEVLVAAPADAVLAAVVAAPDELEWAVPVLAALVDPPEELVGANPTHVMSAG